MKNAFIFVLFLILIACVRKAEESSRLTISVPPSSSSSNMSFAYGGQSKSIYQSVSTQSSSGGTDWNEILNPNVLADVNCYLIAVTGPEPEMQRNTCTTTDGISFKVGKWIGAIPEGSTLQLEVPSGASKEIIAVGFKALPGACRNMKGTDPDGANLSEPHILGKVVQNLPPGNVVVSVPISLTANTKKIDDCSGPDFDFSSNGPSLYFGQGTMDVNLAMGSNCLTGPLSDTCMLNNASANVFDTQASASARLGTVVRSPVAPNEVTVTALGSEANNFAIGQEVLIHITAGRGTSGSGAPDYDACGYHAFTGSYAFAKIVDKPSSATYRLSRGTMLDELYKDMDNDGNLFDPDDLAASNARLAAGATSSNFCYIQMVRVPHLKTLTVNSNTKLSANPLNILTDSGGGILVLRVSDYLQMGSSAEITMSSAGFQGENAKAGQGIFGSESANCSSANTFSGGGCDNGAGTGAGGGHGSMTSPIMGSVSGGYGYNPGTAIGGKSVGDDCGDGSCFGNLNHKIYHGGAGGGVPSAVPGGAGGGIVMIFAKKIKPVNDGGLISSVGASSGSGQASGGGAGGSIHLVYREYDETALAGGLNLYERPMIFAGGGSSTSVGSYRGGGGGGGRIHISSCKTPGGINTTISSAFVLAAQGTVPAGGTNVGTNGMIGSKVFSDLTCPP